MPLDIYAARSKQQAARRQRLRVTIDETVHGLLFAGGELHRNFALLSRLADYYSDASFHWQVLDALREEIARAMAKFPDEPVCDVLLSLDRLCRDAKNGGMNLYALCA